MKKAFVVILLFLTLITTVSASPDIEVLNPQEYPELHGTWTVYFTTGGQNDLLIEGKKGTDYGSMFLKDAELEIVQLKCGQDIVYDRDLGIAPRNMRSSSRRIIFEDYECDKISSWTVQLIKCNIHQQMLSFGTSYDIANNACAGTDYFSVIIRDPDGVEVQTCGQYQISPTYGDTDPCDEVVGVSPTCKNPVTCEKLGAYTAEVVCDSCSFNVGVPEAVVMWCDVESSQYNITIWNINNEEQSNNIYINLAKALMNVNYGGELSIVGTSNVSIQKVEINRRGDAIYIYSGSNLILK